MTKIKTLQGGNSGSTQDSKTLIKGAFERPDKDKPDTSGGDIKTPTAIRDGVGETGEQVIKIIKDL